MAMVMSGKNLTVLPEWLKAVISHHYTTEEMIIVALVGMVIGMGYGWWVKKRLRRQRGQSSITPVVHQSQTKDKD